MTMPTDRALTLIAALLEASEHPDIVNVGNYGKDDRPGGQSPTGIRVTHRNQSFSMLWGAVEPAGTTGVPLPDEMPPPRQRAARLLVFVHQLLDVAKPAQLRSWRLCASPGVVVPVAAALRLEGHDGSTAYLRATSGSGGNAEPDAEPFPDYEIPLEGVQRCLQQESVLSAA
ncbi:hypothetical protein [Micromonospora sp. NPDC005652]|uniref:hypothetical protein n=1 Tax=Micromonospora sp. NPDC005652 TaxID=3157046 RepID=UPI0033DA7AB9